MMVSQAMHRGVITVRPMESVHQAVKKMTENNADVVVVLEEDGRFKGVLTERDISMAVADSGVPEPAAGLELAREPLKDLAYDDGNRCCYFSDIMIERLSGA